MASEVNICIVGLGHWGPNIVRSFENNPNAKVVAAVDQSDERRALIKSKIPDLTIYSSLEESLSNHPEINSVVVATPTETHHQVGMQALMAGKHLLMEKPLAHTSESALELLETAERQKVILMTGHIFLYNNAIKEMKRIIDANERRTNIQTEEVHKRARSNKGKAYRAC